MALSYPTLALIFLAIVVAAPGGATLAEANGEPSKKHDANANATAPANPAPEGHPVEASANPVANGDHVVAPAGPVAKGHHPPGKGHHKKGGHRKRHPVDAPAGAPPSPVTEAPPASDPAPKADHANAPEIPATAPQPAYAPARAPSTATPPTGGRVQVPPELKKLLPSLPPSAEPKELKELISKATGMDPSSIPDINDPHQIEEIIGKIGMNGALPPSTDPKQLNDVIAQYSGMKPSDVESFFSKAAGGLSPNGNAGSAEASPSKEEPSGAFTIGATSMATALGAAVAAGCFIF